MIEEFGLVEILSQDGMSLRLRYILGF